MDKELDNWWDHVTYTDAKKCIRENIQSLARDYIAIGFYLRRVRDGELFLEGGYKSIHDFAYSEFGMRKSTVNHCIRINAEFSEGGNSPVIDARYKEFGKTQLQELLYVPEDKRDEATPDMTVAEIREIHKRKRLDDEPEGSEAQRLGNEPGGSEIGRLDDEPEGDGEHFRKEAVADSPGNEPERPGQECQPMQEEKDSGAFPEETETQAEPGAQDAEPKKEMVGDPESIPAPEPDVVDAEYQEDSVKITVQNLLHQKQRELDEWMEAMGDDDCTVVPGIVELGIIVQALELLAGQQDSQEGPETEREIREAVPCVDAEGIMAEVAKARGVGKKAFEEIRKHVEQLFRKDDTSTGSGGQDIEALEEMSKVKEQPPLPVLKNNEQRKEWLKKYQEWGLWYEDVNIGAKYYRYCFENGAELIVEEYQSHSEYVGDYISSYFHLVGGPKASQKNGISRWQRHERYNRYPNSESELVEFLKFIQKGDK